MAVRGRQGGAECHGDNRRPGSGPNLASVQCSIKTQWPKRSLHLILSHVFEREKIPVELLCFALKFKKIYVVVKSLLQDIVAGQNKRLSLRGERAVIRDNISQN